MAARTFVGLDFLAVGGGAGGACVLRLMAQELGLVVERLLADGADEPLGLERLAGHGGRHRAGVRGAPIVIRVAERLRCWVL